MSGDLRRTPPLVLRGGTTETEADGLAMPPVSVEVLEVLVLPWAERVEPAKYRMTVEVRGQAATYRMYLVRLAELRWAADVPGRGTFPLSVLEASAITAQVRHRPSGRVLTVTGRAAPGTRQWAWAELLLTPQEFLHLVEIKSAFDLELIAS